MELNQDEGVSNVMEHGTQLKSRNEMHMSNETQREIHGIKWITNE